MKNLQSDLLVVILAVAGSIFLSAYLYGGFFVSTSIINSIYDSLGYNALGQAIWQNTELPGGRLSQRGYLYPTFATGLMYISPVALIIAQTAAVALGVFFLLRTERALTGRVLFSPFALLSVSLMLSPAHMMTEATGFALASAALFAFVSKTHRPWGVLFLILAALVKPTFLPVAVISGLLILRFDRSSVAVLLVSLVFVLPQLVSTYVADGKIQFSSAGGENFQERFYPAVFGMAETGKFVSYKDEMAITAHKIRPEFSDQVAFVLRNPLAAVKAWGSILWTRHLLESSGYTNRDSGVADQAARERLKSVSDILNKFFVLLIIPAVFGLFAFIRVYPISAWPAGLLAPSIIVTAPLVYWQGDRIVFIGLLLLLPFAGFAFRHVFTRNMAGPKKDT